MENIIRNPTNSEKGDFIPLSTRRGKVKSPNAVLNNMIAKKVSEAKQKELPFAESAVRADIKDEVESQTKASIRKHGYVVAEEIKIPKINWAKYSDLKNFELIGEGEVYDAHLSKRHNLLVYVKKKEYKFIGFKEKYRVMEEPIIAVERARRKAKGIEELKKTTK